MLTVHKNTKQQRDSKELRKALIQEAKQASQLKNISGYALVVWNDEFESDCNWWAQKGLPGLLVPEFVKQVLSRRIGQNDTNDIIDMRFSD